jgi:hypothetical protein
MIIVYLKVNSTMKSNASSLSTLKNAARLRKKLLRAKKSKSNMTITPTRLKMMKNSMSMHS